MKYNELNVSNSKNRTRKGRGISAGKGKTAGRGTKGQNSRSGSKRRRSFEGGQTPLMQRLPKLPGFKSIRKPTVTLTTGQIDKITESEINNQLLAKLGLSPKQEYPVKVVVRGDLKSKKTIKLQAASAGALTIISSAGGSFERVDPPSRTAK